jgi:hypothetical protein
MAVRKVRPKRRRSKVSEQIVTRNTKRDKGDAIRYTNRVRVSEKSLLHFEANASKVRT